MPYKHLRFSLECYQLYVNGNFFSCYVQGNPSVRGVMLALKSQNMQYNFGTFEVAVVLDGVRGSAVG
jgi:hypothetical protein